MTSNSSSPVHESVGIILAAGKGTRMKSRTPKVLHKVAGRSMVDWVRSSLSQAGVDRHCLVLSDDLTGFEQFLEEGEGRMTVAIQENRMGTGDAVAATAVCFDDVIKPSYAAGRKLKGEQISAEFAIICAGDVPCVKGESYARFVEDCMSANAELAVLGMDVPSPKGYGRLVTDDAGNLVAIVEEKDASDEVRQISVCNTGVIFGRTKTLFELLSKVDNNNASGEYYLTDCFKLAKDAGHAVHVHVAGDYTEFGGVNNRLQLSNAEQIIMSRLREEAMMAGVTMRSPATIYLDADASLGSDVVIDPNVVIKGKSVVRDGAIIGAGCYLEDATIGEGVNVAAGSIVVSSIVRESVPAASVLIQ